MLTLEWSSLKWNLAGTVISTSHKSPYNKIFLFKVLYDALPNEITKYKYSFKVPPDYDPNNDPNLPTCPLRSTYTDSLSHLFCNCSDPSIFSLRSKLISDLHALPTNTHPSHPSYPSLHPIIAIIVQTFYPCDHRNLLGLFTTSSINLIQHTVPSSILD